MLLDHHIRNKFDLKTKMKKHSVQCVQSCINKAGVKNSEYVLP